MELEGPLQQMSAAHSNVKKKLYKTLALEKWTSGNITFYSSPSKNAKKNEATRREECNVD